MDTTSQEKLVELRRAGKITDEEYRRLNVAMAPPKDDPLPHPSEEELEELRRAGKINDEEYRRLDIALTPMRDDARPRRNVPWQVWVIIVLLALEGIGNIITIPAQPQALVWIAAKCIFIFGLYRLYRWAFVVFGVVGMIHVVFFAAQGALFVALINATLLAILATCYRRFFPSSRACA